MLNRKKLLYEMKHGKFIEYEREGFALLREPYVKTPKLTDVMKQNDTILNEQHNNSNLTDAQGLGFAYGNGTGFYIDGDKMYIVGTFGKGTVGGAISDILSDVGLPFNMTRHSQRYKDTSKALEENNEVKHLKTHSLGSSVGAQIARDYPERDLSLRTYGAPFISGRSNITDKYINFRSILDPVSILIGQL